MASFRRGPQSARRPQLRRPGDPGNLDSIITRPWDGADNHFRGVLRLVFRLSRSIKYPADQREVERPMGWKYGEFACPIDQGDIDFHRVVRILRDAGYTNDLNIENESLGRLAEGERAAALAREVQYLKRCLASA
jgi:hypothetical protein